MEVTDKEAVYTAATAKFDEFVAANKMACGVEFITSNAIKGILAEFGLTSQGMRAVWRLTKFPNALKTQCQHPGILMDVIGLMRQSGGKDLTEEDEKLIASTHALATGAVIGSLAKVARNLLSGKTDSDDEEEPAMAEIPGMVDVKVMLAHYEKCRQKVGKARESFDKAELDLKAAEAEMERYKPLAKQIENLQSLAMRLKNGEA